MTKKEKQKGHGNQKSSGGRAGSVAENIEKSEIGRSHKRNEDKSRDKHRSQERERGVFHARVNEGRSNDITAAIRGEIGSYAYPGGNRPSVHFNVQKEVFKDSTAPVLRMESVQEKHELEGSVFDPKVYVPCSYVEKFGLYFQSRREDRLAAATQELVVHYLAREVNTFTPEVTEREAADVWAIASESCKSMLSEQDGMYIVRSALGDVVFKVYYLGRKACIKVAASRNPSLDVTNIFVPVHCLFEPSLGQVTDDATYSAQLAMFMFIRTELASLIEEMSKKPTPVETLAVKESLTNADREALAAAAERRERKAKEKFVRQREEQSEKMAVMAMKQNCLSVVQITHGKLGYADLGSSSGELIIGFHIAGNDRIARIEHMGSNHMLMLAGIKKDDCVFASAIQLDKVDRAHCTTEADFRKRSILASHIREQMEVRGIRFRTKQSA
jgi:hypothetical protein